jgi:hypothetical protein
MSEIDSILDELDPKDKKRAPLPGGLNIPLLVLVAVLVLAAAFAAGLAVSSATSRQVPQPAVDESPNRASTERLWELLMKEMPSCVLQESLPALSDVESRTVALFAAVRFNCVEVVKGLVAGGVNLDEKRFIKGQVVSLDEYAGQFGAIDVVKLVQDERAKREKALTKIANRLGKTPLTKEQIAEEQRRRGVQALLAEEAELRKSIHYDRARLDCEALRERLGFSAGLVDMTDCIRKGIEVRRADREELGHNIPK